MKINTTTSSLCCFFCGRDLSQAISVRYVAEGPVCSMCIARIIAMREQRNDEDENKNVD